MSYLAALAALTAGNLLVIAAVVISLAVIAGVVMVVVPRRRRDGARVPVVEEVDEMVDDMKDQLEQARAGTPPKDGDGVSSPSARR